MVNYWKYLHSNIQFIRIIQALKDFLSLIEHPWFETSSMAHTMRIGNRQIKLK